MKDFEREAGLPLHLPLRERETETETDTETERERQRQRQKEKRENDFSVQIFQLERYCTLVREKKTEKD